MTPHPFHERLLAEPLNVKGRVQASGGWVSVCGAPGLGAELDRDFVRKYRLN